MMRWVIVYTLQNNILPEPVVIISREIPKSKIFTTLFIFTTAKSIAMISLQSRTQVLL